MKQEHKELLRYMAKCVAGVLFVLGVGGMVPLLDISWIVISMLLVLSPDGAEALPLTLVRVKSNLVASLASVTFLLVSPSVTLAVCLAIVTTIAVCYHFKLMAGSRVGLAAVIIISLHPQGTYLWSTALVRIASVGVGCSLGLLLTYIFHYELVTKATNLPDKNASE